MEFIDTSFTVHNKVYLGEQIMCTWLDYILHFLGSIL